ncbi:hypothetical protein ACPC54_18490 [Kitasatospora sp. NPDC094028]
MVKMTVELDSHQAATLQRAAGQWGLTPQRLLATLAGLVRVDTALADEGLGGPILALDAEPAEERW